MKHALTPFLLAASLAMAQSQAATRSDAVEPRDSLDTNALDVRIERGALEVTGADPRSEVALLVCSAHLQPRPRIVLEGIAYLGADRVLLLPMDPRSLPFEIAVMVVERAADESFGASRMRALRPLMLDGADGREARNRQPRLFSMLTNLMRSYHAAAMAVIRNIPA